jgi:hypothetical protein
LVTIKINEHKLGFYFWLNVAAIMWNDIIRNHKFPGDKKNQTMSSYNNDLSHLPVNQPKDIGLLGNSAPQEETKQAAGGLKRT